MPEQSTSAVIEQSEIETLVDALRLAIKDTHRRESHTKGSFRAIPIQLERERYIATLGRLQCSK